MGTHSCIAKPEGDGWRGRYVHWDGYPTGVGVTLVTALTEAFKGDLDAMTAKLIDNEPVGWSIIAGADLSQPGCWVDSGDRPNNAPASYSARGETGDTWITSQDEAFPGVEWVYVLTPSGVMVWEGDGGAFGMGGGNFRDPVMVPWGDVVGMAKVEQDTDVRNA